MLRVAALAAPGHGLRLGTNASMKRIASILLLLCVGAADAQDVKRLADYMAEAKAAVDGISARESMRLRQTEEIVFVDIRDSAEVKRAGKVVGAVHVPRGMLEFYIDPDSSLHNRLFSSDKKIVFYCATGGRSLLAAKLAKDMGVKDSSHLEGGFRAWSRAGGDTEK